MTVTSATAATAATAQTSALPGTSLNANDFLKLLTTQLTTQNPLEPMKDTDFMAQMASFTSLEQMRTLSQDFASFSQEQRMTAAQGYLGRLVSVNPGGGSSEVTGIVTSVRTDGAKPQITIGGVDYDVTTVNRIQEVPSPAAAPTIIEP